MEIPRALYRAAAERGQAVYEVDPDRSSATILVRRAGPLARFGHDHAVVARNPDGLVLLAPESLSESRADLRVTVRDLEIDPPTERARFELDTTPDADDVAATRANLLRAVLMAERWPEVYLQMQWAEGELPQAQLKVRITLNGQTRAIAVPARIAAEGDDLRAHGTFRLQQSQWGIEPFSALGGALRVADEVDVVFDVLARRTPPDRIEKRKPHADAGLPRPFSRGSE